MNVDFSRSSPNTCVLSDFITDFNLYTCIDLPNTNAPYTIRELIICVCQDHALEV